MESEGELRELLARLQADTTASQEFRERYRGSWDALDALAWRVDPAVLGPSGATNPLAQVRELEVLVHSRPAGAADEARRVEATARLQALLAEKEREDAALDEAIRADEVSRASAPIAQDDETAHPEPTETDAPGRSIVPFAAAAVGTLVLGGLFAAALAGSACGADGCSPTAAPASPSPSLTAVAKPEVVGFDALWAALTDQFPDAVRPDVELVHYVPEAETTAQTVSCLNAAGFPEAQLAGDGIQVRSVGEGQRREALNIAMYTCRLQYPPDPLEVFDRTQNGDEAGYQESAPRGVGVPDPGSVRLLYKSDNYLVIAYRLTLPTEAPAPLVCAQIEFLATKTSSGSCASVDDFHRAGLKPSGLIWTPQGDLKITGGS